MKIGAAMEHNAEELQEILKRTIQGIVSITIPQP